MTVPAHVQQGPDPLLSVKAAARVLDVGESTLRRWLREGWFPEPDVRLRGVRLRWRLSTVDGWIAAQAEAQRRP